MKKLLFVSAIAAVILSSCGNNAQQHTEAVVVENDSTVLIFPMGPKASGEKFIGTAYVNELLPKATALAWRSHRQPLHSSRNH